MTVIAPPSPKDRQPAQPPRPSATWEAVVEPVRPFLRATSESLEAQVATFEPEIAEHARYALNNQGKQLRPILVALAGGALGNLNADHVTVAVIIEMVHLATLVHDDIMDQALLRRRQPTLASAAGNDVAVLVGDCLFAHALKLAAGFPTNEICGAVASATKTVCTGEILQTHRRRRWTVGRAEYFRMVEMKTAELFALACELGAACASAGSASRSALRRFGLELGTAYQVYDDCLDLYGVEGDAGKTLGMDLAGGKLTLPAILYLEDATPQERTELLRRLDHWQPSMLAGVRELLESRDALSRTTALVQRRLDTARSALDELPPSAAHLALNSLAIYLSERLLAIGAR